MNDQIKDLYHRAGKEKRLIIGLMSGTSMDGLDIALCSFQGNGINTRIELLNFTTATYSKEFRDQLNTIFARRDADLELVCLMNEHIGNVHGELINKSLAEWGYKNSDIDFIASHGQTIYHAPKWQHKLIQFPNGTLQIGDGDHIAVKTGIITLADFRQKHLAAGGEGAPLAVYGDYLVFSKIGEHRILLNMGGISNFTYLPASGDPSAVFSTDIGPGNTMMDQYVQKYFNQFYDEDALIASKGKVNTALLSALLANDFFKLPFPKTTGPELFNLNYLEEAKRSSHTQNIAQQDVMATLCNFSAEAIAGAIKSTFPKNETIKIFTSGGGMHNPLLIKLLTEKISNATFDTTAVLGINPDAKEAVLFAILANETLCGKNLNFGKGVPSISMGKISLPT